MEDRPVIGATHCCYVSLQVSLGAATKHLTSATAALPTTASRFLDGLRGYVRQTLQLYHRGTSLRMLTTLQVLTSMVGLGSRV